MKKPNFQDQVLERSRAIMISFSTFRAESKVGCCDGLLSINARRMLVVNNDCVRVQLLVHTRLILVFLPSGTPHPSGQAQPLARNVVRFLHCLQACVFL